MVTDLHDFQPVIFSIFPGDKGTKRHKRPMAHFLNWPNGSREYRKINRYKDRRTDEGKNGIGKKSLKLSVQVTTKSYVPDSYLLFACRFVVFSLFRGEKTNSRQNNNERLFFYKYRKDGKTKRRQMQSAN